MRGHVRPLSDNPQLEIIRTQLSERIEDAATEYKVHNFRQRKDGTIQGGNVLSWIDVVWLAFLVVAWRRLDMALQAREAFLEKYLTVCAYCPLYESELKVQIPLVVWLIFALLLLLRKTRTVLSGELLSSIQGVRADLQNR
jgi:hypothetical protein